MLPAKVLQGHEKPLKAQKPLSVFHFCEEPLGVAICAPMKNPCVFSEVQKPLFLRVHTGGSTAPIMPQSCSNHASTQPGATMLHLLLL
jgi:hypothetical protein